MTVGAGLVPLVWAAARAAGRDPASIGLEAWVSLGGLSPEAWAAEANGWRALGATHLAVNTEFTSGMHWPSGATTVDEHLRLLEMTSFSSAVSRPARWRWYGARTDAPTVRRLGGNASKTTPGRVVRAWQRSSSGQRRG